VSEKQVRAPEVDITWEGKTISTDSVRMRIAVGQDPTVSVAAFSGPEASSSSQPALSADAADLMGRAQQAAATGVPKQDFNMNLRDGAGGSLDFKGIVAGPTYMMDSQGKSIRPAIGAISACGIVANLQLSNYLGPTKDPKESIVRKSTVMEERPGSSNLSQRMSELTDGMIEAWLRHRVRSNDVISDRIRSNIHLANEGGPLGEWRKILANSMETLDLEWLSTMKDNKTTNFVLNGNILRLLRSPTGSFLETIGRVAQAFSLQYVPQRNGSAGRLEPREKRMTGELLEKDIPATSVFMGGDLPRQLMPVQQVIVVGKTRPSTIEASSRVKSEDAVGVAGYPLNATTANGNIMTIPLPFYLELYSMTSAKGISTRGIPTIDSAVRAFRNIRDLTQTNLNTRDEALMSSYAKSVYNDAALGSYSSQISVPLDLGWEVGRRYSLSTGGVALFRGFLASVEHTVSRGEMGSSLDFTHVEYGSYRLPT